MRAYRPSLFCDEEDEFTDRFVPPDRELTVRIYARRARAGLPLFPPRGAATALDAPGQAPGSIGPAPSTA